MINKLIRVAKKYDKVNILMHNNPDSDAIASAVGLSIIFDNVGISNRVIYFGKEITKPNLCLAINLIPKEIEHIETSLIIEDTELLLYVDCQYGNSNVPGVQAKNIACVDHHNVELFTQYEFSDIRREVGACVSLVISYFNQLQLEIPGYFATIAYFGLRTDTSNFMVKFSETDKASKESIEGIHDHRVVSDLLRTSLHATDIELFRIALENRIMVNDNIIVTYLPDADDIILGQLSDLLSEVVSVETVIVISERDSMYKLSIRVYHEYMLANELVTYLLRGIGDGGGHPNKSGGVAFKSNLAEGSLQHFVKYIVNKTLQFNREYLYFDLSKGSIFETISRDDFFSAHKKLYNIRYLELYKHFDEDANITIQTLEGAVTVSRDKIIIFGLIGEVYPVDPELFFSKHTLVKDTEHQIAVCDYKLNESGIIFDGGHQQVTITNEDLTELPIAQTTGNNIIEALYVDQPLKVRMTIGDLYSERDGYLVYRNDSDAYICDGTIFELSYNTIKENSEEVLK